MDSWTLVSKGYKKETLLHNAPVNTLGNGLVGCRGFFEEMQEGIAGLGGIYMARVLGRADYTPWAGTGRELVNLANFFWVHIRVNGEELAFEEENLQELETRLDLHEGSLHRQYMYVKNGQPLLRLEFFRFLSYANIYTAGQRLRLTALQEDIQIEACLGIRTDVTNLNLVSSEPWPVQPGRKQFEVLHQDPAGALIEIQEPDTIRLAFGQKVHCGLDEGQAMQQGLCFRFALAKGQTAEIEKMLAFALSPEDGMDVETALATRMEALPSFAEGLAAHQKAMAKRWEMADVELEGNEEDQLTLRYNLYQLMASCPEHTEYTSIGARGLTGEMYEGSIFWDTEIFMLPFFTLTRPAAARQLLRYRYHTLPKAREHAKSNWFEGAMYGWQVNPLGEEQTPPGVGAYYSVHVVADIAYAIMEYWHCTGDEAFMVQEGLEILIETSRFWASRVTQLENGQYEIIAVRGPNEYDVLVNNNLYTNLMARENMRICLKLLADLGEKSQETQTRTGCSKAEKAHWQEICENLVLPRDERQNLWLEDDSYLRRKPLDMQRAKPGSKRIIDTTIPYEALPFYQVSKQADVLHAMKNLPWYFSKEEVETAYDYYLPRTAFDSSLSYSMFALMAARLGRMDTAESFFQKTATLDIQNLQLNTISGLHFANFGGTWQTAVFGFGGVSVLADRLCAQPHLPPRWQTLRFRLRYKGARLAFQFTHTRLQVILEEGEGPLPLRLDEQDFCLSAASPVATLQREDKADETV